MITLDSSSIEVQEDDGNVMVCLETDDAICLIVHSQEKEAGIVAIIRESVDSLYRDDTGEISRDPRTKRLKTR